MDRSNFTDRAIAANLVTEVLIPGDGLERPRAVKCEKIHIWPTIFSLLAVGHLCADEVPSARAITACLRQQKANLSDACRAVFEQ
jgi:hypothetical protein